jgi:hypothetical protein
VLGPIGDEQHCKPQTSVVVARPLRLEAAGAAAAAALEEEERPHGSQPGTPPLHPWHMQQQPQPWRVMPPPQRGEGEEVEEERVAMKVCVSRSGGLSGINSACVFWCPSRFSRGRGLGYIVKSVFTHARVCAGGVASDSD